MQLRVKPTQKPPQKTQKAQEKVVVKRAPGAGRPKGDPNQVRNVQAYVALTEEEKISLLDEARESGLTLSFYIRKRLELPIDGAIKPAEVA